MSSGIKLNKGKEYITKEIEALKRNKQKNKNLRTQQTT